MANDHYTLPKKLYGDMPWITVDSSNIKRMYYVERSKQLYIEFMKKTVAVSADDSQVYVYFDVEPQEFNKLRNAESIGKQFWAGIRDVKKFARVIFTDPDNLPTKKAKKIKVSR